jgi:hypothetical protein
MQANSFENQTLDSSQSFLAIATADALPGNAMHDDAQPVSEPIYFHGNYANVMEMFADAATVADYLDIHREWFTRCAHPMQTRPLGQNGYDLTIGKFGSFGYEVEPKIGLNLLPQDHGVYRIQTMPIPDYTPPGYEVDFRAALQLVEIDTDPELYYVPGTRNNASLPLRMTCVEWELKLVVAIQFPRFIHTLPRPIIQNTGDSLLNQIVRQVSRCLTIKVQKDFHSTREIPFPQRRKKFPWNRGSGSHPELMHPETFGLLDE